MNVNFFSWQLLFTSVSQYSIHSIHTLFSKSTVYLCEWIKKLKVKDMCIEHIVHVNLIDVFMFDSNNVTSVLKQNNKTC